MTSDIANNQWPEISTFRGPLDDIVSCLGHESAIYLGAKDLLKE